MRAHPIEDVLDLVVFLPPSGEFGTGEQRISPGAELRGHVPTGKRTDTCPWVRFPHRYPRVIDLVVRPGSHQDDLGHGYVFGKENG